MLVQDSDRIEEGADTVFCKVYECVMHVALHAKAEMRISDM